MESCSDISSFYSSAVVFKCFGLVGTRHIPTFQMRTFQGRTQWDSQSCVDATRKLCFKIKLSWDFIFIFTSEKQLVQKSL